MTLIGVSGIKPLKPAGIPEGPFSALTAKIDNEFNQRDLFERNVLLCVCNL